MRTISADNEAILRAGARAVAIRMQVKDAGGTFRDLSTYPGVDLLEKIEWSENLDAEGVTWSATLTREQRLISAAPFVQASPLNRGFDPAASYAPLLQVGREMKVEYSIQAYGDPRARSWATAFGGYVDTVDSASGDNVQLTGRGLEAVIINCFIERERVYGFCQGTYATKGAYIWPDPSKGTAYTTFAVGDLMIPTDTKRNDHFYRATAITTGIVAATEPTWPTGAGSTVVDGGVTWTESGATSTSTGTAVETVIQQALNDNLAAPPTIWVPVSPGEVVRWFLIGRQPLFAELKALADQVGWCFRYMDNAGTPALKLFDPLRATTTSLRTFAPGQYLDPTKLSVDWKTIRNKVRVVFSDSQDLDASKNPIRKAVVQSDATSITKYNGTLFCELGEDSTGNIDTTATADALALKVLSDLSEPTADMQIPLAFFFFAVEMADLYTFGADGVRFDSDQKMAISQYSHSFSLSTPHGESTFMVRGKPASNSAAGWFARMTDAVGGESHQLTVIENLQPIAVAVDPKPVGGVNITFDWGGSKKPKDGNFELHLATAPGVVASPATLVATGKDQNFSVMNLDPAKPHYGVIVPITRNGQQPVRGSQSEEFTFTPGRALATHLNNEVGWGNFPLNGGFETWNDPAVPPDFWEWGGTGGSLWGGGGGIVTSDDDGLQGDKYLRLLQNDTPEQPLIYSARFPVNEKARGKVSVWLNSFDNGATIRIGFFGETYLRDFVIGGLFETTTNTSTNPGVWRKVEFFVTPAASTRFARIVLSIDPGFGDTSVLFDSVSWEEVDEDWHTVGAAGEPTYSNSWVAFTGGTTDAQFRRAADHGEMRGAVKSGSSSTAAIFTLPAELWPLRPVIIPVASNGAYGELSISTAGVVKANVGNTTKLSLDGVRWPLE